MTATYAVLLSGETTMPRGWRPIGIFATSFFAATSTTLRSKLHQFDTSTCFWSGVTATYLGTTPTPITWSTLLVLVSIRYR